MNLRGGMPYESARSTPRPRRMCILQEKVRLRVKPPAAPHPGHVTALVCSVSPAGCSVIGRAKKNILNHKRTPSEIRSYTKAAPWRHLCLFEESSYGTVKTTEWTCWLGADCLKFLFKHLLQLQSSGDTIRTLSPLFAYLRTLTYDSKLKVFCIIYFVLHYCTYSYRTNKYK